MTAEILCVGTELLLGNIVNTNAAFLGRELAAMGIFAYNQSVVGDNAGRLKESLKLAISRSDIVIITGGLGPTYDDLTKETVAEYFGLKMEMHQESLERLQLFYKQFNREMTPNNKKQAVMPEKSIVFQNNYGTAPALAVVANCEYGMKTVIMLPGPPREMEPMFREEVKPFLQKQSDIVLVSQTVHIIGMGESAVEHKLYDLMKNSTNPTVAPYAKEGEVELRVTASGKDENECMALIEPVVEKIKNEIGEYIYGIDVKSLQNALIAKLSEKKLTIAVAESCTGGLVGKRITEISGSSSVYLGGVISYDNSVKIKMLGVRESTLEQFGAVSEQTAIEMAEGVMKNLSADIGISTTGIAGPMGGSEEKPVGLVYVGVYCKKMDISKAIKFNFARGLYRDEREFIRYLASSNALNEALKICK